MKHKYFYLVTATALGLISSSAFGATVFEKDKYKITLSGTLYSEFVYAAKNSNPKEQASVGLMNYPTIGTSFKYTIDEKSSTSIGLTFYPNTSSFNKTFSYLRLNYTHSDIGTFIVGNYYPAAYYMGPGPESAYVNGYPGDVFDYAPDLGLPDNSFSNYYNGYFYPNNIVAPNFISAPNSFRFIYLTPDIEGYQFGISYMPFRTAVNQNTLVDNFNISANTIARHEISTGISKNIKFSEDEKDNRSLGLNLGFTYAPNKKVVKTVSKTTKAETVRVLSQDSFDDKNTLVVDINNPEAITDFNGLQDTKRAKSNLYNGYLGAYLTLNALTVQWIGILAYDDAIDYTVIVKPEVSGSVITFTNTHKLAYVNNIVYGTSLSLKYALSDDLAIATGGSFQRSVNLNGDKSIEIDGQNYTSNNNNINYFVAYVDAGYNIFKYLKVGAGLEWQSQVANYKNDSDETIHKKTSALILKTGVKINF